MLTRVLVFLCGMSPGLRRALWRWWYNKLARQIRAGDWRFMNYGFAGGEALKLSAEDEGDRFCIQLYARVIGGVDLRGKEVLEVGSGRGGGASFVARDRGAAKVVGVDYSGEAVKFCGGRYGEVANLSFRIGDAENLPFEDGSFDVVVNVESSHCYGNFRKFLSEVSRVLRPGGYFLFADLREPREMEQVRGDLKATAGFEILEEEDISRGVLAAMKADDARKRALIESLVAPSLRPIFQEFAGVSGGKVFENLKSGRLVYGRFVVRRADSNPR